MNRSCRTPRAAVLLFFSGCWLFAASALAQNQASATFASGHQPTIRASNEYSDHIWVEWSVEGEPQRLWRTRSADGRGALKELTPSREKREYRDYDETLLRGAKYYYRLEYLPSGSTKTAKTDWVMGSLLVWAAGADGPSIRLDDDTRDAGNLPLRWSAVPGATGYLLQIMPARDSALWTAAGGFPLDRVEFVFLDTLHSTIEALDWVPPAGFSGRVCATVKALGIVGGEFAPPLVFEARNPDLPMPIALNLTDKRPDAAGNWITQLVFKHLGDADLSYAAAEFFLSDDRVLDPEDESFAQARNPEKDRLVAKRSLRRAARQSPEGLYALDVQVYLPPAQPGKYYLIARIGSRHVVSSEPLEIR